MTRRPIIGVGAVVLAVTVVLAVLTVGAGGSRPTGSGAPGTSGAVSGEQAGPIGGPATPGATVVPAPGHELFGFVPYWEMDGGIAAHLAQTPLTTLCLFSVTNKRDGTIDTSQQGYKKIATISQDYTFGHEQCGGLAQVFTEGGGEIVQQFWHPLNTADFSPYLGQLADLKVDAIFAMETGADATRFIQQYASFGLKGKIPLLGAMNATDQSVIRTMGDECEGIIAAAHFAEGSDNPVTQKFTQDYQGKYGKIPSLYGFSMYSGIMWVAQAVEKLGGKVEDRDLLIDTVLKTELTGSPLGKTVKLDSYGNPIYDVQIRKVVERADGKYWNVPIATYPNVSQFWTYNPETYMKQPPYSRSFQGIKKT